jgi:hypothetical protein
VDGFVKVADKVNSNLSDWGLWGARVWWFLLLRAPGGYIQEESFVSDVIIYSELVGGFISLGCNQGSKIWQGSMCNYAVHYEMIDSLVGAEAKSTQGRAWGFMSMKFETMFEVVGVSVIGPGSGK